MNSNRTLATILTLSAALLASGCATDPVILQGAAHGAEMAVELRRDINTVIKAQDWLYEERLQAAVTSINELYSEKQRYRLIEERRAFAKANANADADAVADKVTAFMANSMKKWSQRHVEYKELVDRARKSYEDNRRKIEADESKLKVLRAKLISLSDARTRADSIRFMIGFAKEVRRELAELEKQDGASE